MINLNYTQQVVLLVAYLIIFFHDWYYAIHKAHEKTIYVLRDFFRMQLTHLLQFNVVLVYIFVGVPLIIRTILFPKTIYKNWFYLAKAVLFVLGIDVRVFGALPKDGNFVVVGNHTSFLDIFLTAYYFNGKKGTVFLHKKLLKVPVLGWWMKRLGVIPILPPTVKYESATLEQVRQKTFSEKISAWMLPEIKVTKREMAEINIAGKNKALKTLSEGNCLVVFAEGTRTSNGQMKQFEDSAFSMAKKAGVPVIPIAFVGSYEAKPKWRHYIKPMPVIIRIGKPIDGSTMSVKEFAEKTQHIVQEMIDE